jgi:hypothetical protein
MISKIDNSKLFTYKETCVKETTIYYGYVYVP